MTPPSKAFRFALADVAAGVAPLDGTGTHGSAAWWIRNDLAAPAYALARDRDRALAAALRRDALGSAAASAELLVALAGIEDAFAAAGIEMVLLKGAAVASWAYVDPGLRSMTDVDVWVLEDRMRSAAGVLDGLGYVSVPGREHRSEELERRSGGEIVFRGEGRESVRIELHYSAFQGWWTRRVARPDAEGAWRRAESAGPGRHARRLAAEDAVLQIVVHSVVNGFTQAPLRALLDLAVASRRRAIDWTAVAERAVAWRLSTATWLVLDLADRIFGLRGCGDARDRLHPGAVRCAAVRAFVTEDSLLAGRAPEGAARRLAFLLTLVDRPRDAARLVGRIVWPEPWWLAARYGGGSSRIRHLARLARGGEV